MKIEQYEAESESLREKTRSAILSLDEETAEVVISLLISLQILPRQE